MNVKKITFRQIKIYNLKKNNNFPSDRNKIKAIYKYKMEECHIQKQKTRLFQGNLPIVNKAEQIYWEKSLRVRELSRQ